MNSSRGRGRMGLLVPFTNTNLEPDMAMMRPDGISLHIARMGGYDADEIPDAEQMHGLGAADLNEPLRLLMGTRPDVIFYGCTSATLTHGSEFDRDLARRIKNQSGAATVTAAGALVHALKTMAVTHVGFASPYVPAINDMAIDFLTGQGIETVARSEIDGVLDNEGQGALDPEAVIELALAADHVDAQALVLSCTDMRSTEVLARLESTLGKPVICSNQAMMFEALQLMKIDEPIAGFGQLLERERL